MVYYEYDANNRLISSNDGRTTTVYNYDCNGNMVKSSGEEDIEYLFNGAGELAEVWNKGEVYTYEYDHTGLRIAKTVDGVTTSMVTDGMYVVAEHVEAGSTYYYRGMNLIGYTSEENIGYYRFNAHGDVVAVVDTAGEIVTEYSYDPFGKLEDDENEWLKILFGIYVEDNNPFRYCAEYYDTETEFIYLRARFYSPDLQRFISEDPIRFAENWYVYCGNMPIIYVDKTGAKPERFDLRFCSFRDRQVQPKKNIPDWVNRIISGNAQYEDYQQAINIDVNEWQEFSQYSVVKAHDIATRVMSNSLYTYEAANIENLSINESAFAYDLDRFKTIYNENKDLYARIAEATGIPPQLIAAIHYRESGCNFNTYLHNGDPLGKPTTNYPQGIYFDNFEEAAIDALSGKSQLRDAFNLSASSTDMAAMAAFAERYNGLGYYNKDKISPYVYSGTSIYTGGKYVRDGVYDANVVDKQPGVYILISAII